jgi:hypothetical protein
VTSSKTDEGRLQRVLVVGVGARFLRDELLYVTDVLARRYPVAAIPMRQLIPTFLYPGRARVASVTRRLDYDPGVEVLEGIDWYWVP